MVATAIENFSSWRRSKRALVVLLLLTALPGCESLKTRSDQAATQKPKAVSQTTPQPSTSPAATPPPTEAPVTAPSVGSAPAPTPAPTTGTMAPSFLAKELPRVGLILGPGGMKTFAEIGVLRELARARIPIRAVVGLEWGAVIGSLYAMQGQVNDTEWKALKLREQEIPDADAGHFLSSTMKPQTISALSSFFDTIYGAAEIEANKIDFACPAYWSRTDQFGFMSRGPIREAMRACLPYPPLYSENAGVRATPAAIEEASHYLRAHGANLVILVNVLSQGEFLPAKLAADQPSDQLLWSEVRREMMRAHGSNVQFVINVNTSGHPLTDFNGRRQLIEIGAKASSEVVGKLTSQYGF